MPIKEYEAFKFIVSCFMKKINGLDNAPEIYYSSQFEEIVYQENNMVMPITMLSAGYQSLSFYSKKTPTSKVGDWEMNCVCYLLDRAS